MSHFPLFCPTKVFSFYFGAFDDTCDLDSSVLEADRTQLPRLSWPLPFLRFFSLVFEDFFWSVDGYVFFVDSTLGRSLLVSRSVVMFPPLESIFNALSWLISSFIISWFIISSSSSDSFISIFDCESDPTFFFRPLKSAPSSILFQTYQYNLPAWYLNLGFEYSGQPRFPYWVRFRCHEHGLTYYFRRPFGNCPSVFAWLLHLHGFLPRAPFRYTEPGKWLSFSNRHRLWT